MSKELKVTIDFKPRVDEYIVFDDFMEYHKVVAEREEFEFRYEPYVKWRHKTINDVNYYFMEYHSDLLLIESEYVRMLNTVEKEYNIHECDLIKTQHNSNTRYTGGLATKEDVINYMRSERNSWLPQIYKEIDEEVKELTREYQIKVDKLNGYKTKLQDDDYLKSKIRTEIIIKNGEVSK